MLAKCGALGDVITSIDNAMMIPCVLITTTNH